MSVQRFGRVAECAPAVEPLLRPLSTSPPLVRLQILGVGHRREFIGAQHVEIHRYGEEDLGAYLVWPAVSPLHGLDADLQRHTHRLGKARETPTEGLSIIAESEPEFVLVEDDGPRLALFPRVSLGRIEPDRPCQLFDLGR